MTLKDLDKHLSDWVNQELINAEQAQGIRQFEADRAPGSRLRLSLTILAVLSMGLGVINVIAANWEMIPGWLKLVTYFSMMLAQVWAVLRWDQKPGPVREGLHFFYCLAILAGIGLIAQIYHVPSSGWRGLALWSALSLGVMLRSRSGLTVALWYGAFTAAWLNFIFEGSSNIVPRLEAFMLTVALLSIAASWNGRRALPEPQRSSTLFLGTAFLMIAGPWCLTARQARPHIGHEWLVAALVAALWLYVLRFRLRGSQLVAAGVVAAGFFARWWIVAGAQHNLLERLPNLLEALAFLIEMSALGLLTLHFNRPKLFDALTLLMAIRIIALFFTLFSSILMTGAGMIIFGAVVLALLHLWHRHHDRLQSWLKEKLQ